MRLGTSVFLAVIALSPLSAWAQGTPLGGEFRVNTYTTGIQSTPSVASDATGNFVVIWNSVSQGAAFGRRFAPSGIPLGPEFSANASSAAVASDSSGNFVVVGVSPDGSSLGIFGQRYSSAAAPIGPSFRVNTYTTDAQTVVDVASDASGNFVVAWQSSYQDGSFNGVFAQRYANSGMPLGPEFRVNTSTVGIQTYPSVGFDGGGNFVIVWANFQNGDGSFKAVIGQRYDSAGTPMGGEFRVNTYTPNDQSNPSIAVGANGNFVVVWTSFGQDGWGTGIFGQRFASSGAPTGPEFRVNTFTTGYQIRPSVSADAAGDFVVAWETSPDGSFGVNNINAQRFNGTGPPLGSEFMVNTYTTGNQSRPATAADTTGRFVVVWQDATQDGSSDGIFAQRYAPIFPVDLTRFVVE